jgi:hypothetical protein
MKLQHLALEITEEVSAGTISCALSMPEPVSPVKPQ